MSKTATASDSNVAPLCDSVVGQTDKAGLERMQRAADKFESIFVRQISEKVFIEHMNCHSQRDSNSPALGIPAGQHVLPADQIPYMLSWTGDKPNVLAEFWEEVSSCSENS